MIELTTGDECQSGEKIVMARDIENKFKNKFEHEGPGNENSYVDFGNRIQLF